jgi:hypothetical protein
MMVVMAAGLSMGLCSVLLGLVYLSRAYSTAASDSKIVSRRKGAPPTPAAAITAGEKAGLLGQSRDANSIKSGQDVDGNVATGNKCFDKQGFYVAYGSGAVQDEYAQEANDTAEGGVEGAMKGVDSSLELECEGLSVAERARLKAQSIISQTSPR